jgi:carboxypeptidase Taq
MNELLIFYEEYKNKVAAFRFATGSMYFDQATYTPKDGALYANEMLSIISGESFTYSTDPNNIKKIETLYEKTEDPELKKEIGLRLRELHQISLLPKEVYIDFEKAKANSQRCWEQAKAENNYEIFKPHLVSLIKKKKEMLKYFNYECSDYDYLLDQYQVGMDIKKYDAFFQEIKDSLVPLIHQINTTGKQIDDSILYQEYDIENQKKFTEVLKEAFQINPKNCYLTESVHPFSAFFSKHDTRITTKYLKDNILSAILSTIHEYGHALYYLQLNESYQKTTFASEIGYAMHESQSRLLENHIGRHPSFWKSNFPKLQERFPSLLKDVSLDDFMNMMNVSRPSLIRIEADELTYPLHILIRYELEKEIFNGTVDYNNLDVAWADKYEEYLGVRPQTHAEGILQDVHWSGAQFGYFPTYALGSAFSAQMFHQLEKDIDVDTVLANGQFDKVAEWLASNIHQFGAKKSFEEILVDVTGEPFNPKYYTDYLVNKYKEIYQIK